MKGRPAGSWSAFQISSMSAQAISDIKNSATKATAILAGGCFWCVETIYQKIEGVGRVLSGYSGGTAETADYETVCSKTTDHAEAVLVEFDPAVISYAEILEIFFTIHDPTTPNRQGNDVGPQYRSAIFYIDDRQKEQAEQAMADFAPTLWDDPIVTELNAFDAFYVGEDYHQGYYDRVGDRNPYCNVVITPKVSKARKTFAHRMTKDG